MTLDHRSDGDYYTLSSITPSVFGLRPTSATLISVLPDWISSTSHQSYSLTPGIPVKVSGQASYAFLNNQDPTLQPAGWLFRGDPLSGFEDANPHRIPPPPAIPQQEPMLVATVGHISTLQGWRIYAVQNNNVQNRFAYLGQYFDKAYKADANGQPTAMETGVLNEYGEFMPTDVGPTVVTTKANTDTVKGQCTVQVTALVVDANHDGTMDTSLLGKDATSRERPFLFWVNNDYDRLDDSLGVLADVEHAACAADTTRYYTDAEYLGFTPQRGPFPGIPSTRDLEDYTRLWIPGLTQILNGDQGLVARLFFRPISGAPAVRMFRSVESDGGKGYLTDASTAATQVQSSQTHFLGIVDSSQYIELDHSSPLSDHLIFCGSGVGTGELVLQLYNNDDGYWDQFNAWTPYALAEHSIFVDLKDIKEMYERWTVGDSGGQVPYQIARLADNDLPLSGQFSYPASPASDTPYVLFVHGWNMATWEKDRFAETAFKRLYWLGYAGRFGSFRWPTMKLKGLEALDVDNFDKSERQAWRSGAPLRQLLTQLNARYPNQVRLIAHSMGNVVAGEALRSSPQVVDTYVAMQAALPARAYFRGSPLRTIPSPFNDNTTELYWSYPPSGGNLCYFAGSAGATIFANYFNAADWALEKWNIDQNAKPANVVSKYSFDQYTGTFYRYRGGSKQQILTCPADTFELFALCVEGQSLALGAQAGVAGVFTTGMQVDLNATFGFGSTHPGHSAQFHDSFAQRAPFWRSLSETLQLPLNAPPP